MPFLVIMSALGLVGNVNGAINTIRQVAQGLVSTALIFSQERTCLLVGIQMGLKVFAMDVILS